LIIIPIAFTLCGFVGIAVTSAGIVLYDQVLWNPLLLIDQWTNRPAAFFAAFSFALATLGTNISANSLSAANDMTVLFPRFINIKRGQVICAFIGGWALCPWEILATSVAFPHKYISKLIMFVRVQGFLSFMNGYTVFLGPFAGIMVADYWLVHRGRVDVAAMYDPHGRYRYTYGFVRYHSPPKLLPANAIQNWRAVLALLLTVPPLFPGLINSINPAIRIGGAIHLFDIAWLFGVSFPAVRLGQY
jgi:NCS1 family nucleobase:cation symporter-1